jgi:hypothetical protein
MTAHTLIKIVLWALLAFWVVMLIITFAYAQTHQHPAKDAALHEQFYSKWNMPNNGHERTSSCCNKHDCYPTPIKQVDGQYYALRREDQKWIPFPASKLEQNQTDERESPDHQSHACIPPPQNGNHVYCATLGTGT